MSSTLQDTLRALYDSEVNFSITCMWDGGIEAKLGDEMNGFVAERTFFIADISRIGPWLTDEAIRIWPESSFAKIRSSAG
jgi:hypothetical protein